MHRDLKPDNIILKKKNVPIKENILKLVDFGLATYQDVDEYLFKRCGTPGFVAPEVINAKRGANVHYSTKCDVFSVGIIFFFMLTGKIPYDGADFQEVLDNNKKAIINYNVKELKYVTPVAMDLLRNMLELNPDDRPSALDCLKHEYFVNQEAASLILDDEEENGIDLSQNLVNFKEKYKNMKPGGVTDSIHFNANPTINGVVDTYGSIRGSGSKNSGMSGNINSINSINKSKKGTNKQISKLKGDKAAKRSSIYRYALMKGGKGVDIQKELEKMCNASMDSYNSGEGDSDSESEGSNANSKTVAQGGNKSRFAKH
jgi:serine/threonine protein kinase